jgi:hypothetical protein
MPNGWRNAWMRCGWVRRFIGDRCDLDVIFLCEITIRLLCIYVY